jgi:hypothetical protein
MRTEVAAMSIKTIETDFKQKLSEQIRLLPEGLNRYRVSTPFQFDDGDHLMVVRDPEGKYMVDCYTNGTKPPLLIFGLPNDDKVRDTTIALHWFERSGLKARSLGIFENQEEVNRKVLARFSDVAGKLFSSLEGNRERIADFLNETLDL